MTGPRIEPPAGGWPRLAGAIALFALAAAPLAAPGADVDGRGVYNRHCYFCHGYSGDARTAAAAALEPPPRDFTAGALGRERMLDALERGRPGTAMQPFAGVLDAAEREAVVDYVRDAFMARGERNLTYHSPVNGWTGDPGESPAAPFVTGALSPDAPQETLDEAARRGRRLYLGACVTCHAPRAADEPLTWRNEAVTWPEGNYLEHGEAPGDPVTAVFERHEVAPPLPPGDPLAGQGERLYQANCAHCHAEDGTGRNWIGSFLEPPPPDFTRRGEPLAGEALATVIEHGIPGTSMPAWRHVLTAEQIRAVVAYLRAVFPRYASR